MNEIDDYTLKILKELAHKIDNGDASVKHVDKENDITTTGHGTVIRGETELTIVYS